MGMAETGYRAVGVVVSRDTVPSGKTIVGAELNHAERSLRSGIGVARKISADHRIYQRGIVSSVSSLGDRIFRTAGIKSRNSGDCNAYCRKENRKVMFCHLKLA